MEGPFDPHSPDTGATEPVAQDGDLHALLERLLGQGDVRPAEPGAADALWPDLFPVATATPDEVSTIVPGPEVLSLESAPAHVPPPVAADAEPARAWEPLVIDSSADHSTNVDDIHAAILASVSVDLEPIAPPALPDPVASEAPAAQPIVPDAVAPDAVTDASLAHDAIVHALLTPETAAYELSLHELLPERVMDLGADAAVDPSATAAMPEVFIAPEVAPVDEYGDTVAFELTQPLALDLEPAVDAAVEVPPTPISSDFIDSLFAADAAPVAAPAETSEAAPAVAHVSNPPAAFSLTPFEPADLTSFDGEDAAVDMGLDVDALWAAAVPELGLDTAPLLDLDEDAPAAPTAVVLPWPSHDPKADASKAQEPQDLIEAALSGLHADLTAEPVEPLRTPDVAAATSHVVFRLAGRIMAIPLAAVSEIARPPRVTRLPHVPAWVLGIANLRGDIVSILDLEGFFSGKTGKSSHEQRMLALRPSGDEVRTAVLVDSVDGIQAFEDARVSRVTRGYDAEVAPFARGLYQLEDELVVVLDADRLLQSKPMRQFEDGAGAR
jgi:chemotaxis signal transduction protein